MWHSTFGVRNFKRPCIETRAANRWKTYHLRFSFHVLHVVDLQQWRCWYISEDLDWWQFWYQWFYFQECCIPLSGNHTQEHNFFQEFSLFFGIIHTLRQIFNLRVCSCFKGTPKRQNIFTTFLSRMIIFKNRFLLITQNISHYDGNLRIEDGYWWRWQNVLSDKIVRWKIGRYSQPCLQHTPILS
jgi:hypothetical protein